MCATRTPLEGEKAAKHEQDASTWRQVIALGKGFRPLQALGVSPETAEAFGSGYAPKGVLRGRYAVPVKRRTGEFLAYAGIAVTKEQTPQLLFHNFDPSTHLFNANRV